LAEKVNPNFLFTGMMRFRVKPGVILLSLRRSGAGDLSKSFALSFIIIYTL
jgi:hypothetical protein